MKKNIPIIILTLIFIFGITIFLLQEYPSVKFENGKTISLELARTELQRSTGLMNRKNIGEDNGMIFIFDNESILNFWMKDTSIPLDIIFLNKDYNIVNIKTMQPCLENSCISYSSEVESKYAIEVNEGFTKQNNISIGQKVIINL